MNKILFLDFETYSECDIKMRGGMNYALHPSTQIICLGYALHDEAVQLWTPAEPDLPECIIQHVESGGLVCAHNLTFDFRIWNYIGHDQLGWPLLSLDQCIDSMALCTTYQVPASLENAGAALKLDIQKDKDGKRLVKICCTPQKNGLQPTPWGPHSESFKRLYRYCKRDVATMREIVRTLPRPHLIPKEHEIWKLTYEMNTSGLPIDLETAKKIRAYVTKYVEKELQNLPKLCNGAFETVNQLAKMKDWAASKGYPLGSLDAEHLQYALDDPACPTAVKTVLEMRQELGMSSTAKYKKMVELECNGHLHDNLLFHGAGPGRWSGRGFQVHNLPRASLRNEDLTDEENDAIVEEAIQKFILGEDIGNPVFCAKALIRAMIKAKKGEFIICSDYSGIENRVLHWLALDEPTLDDFRNKIDQYKVMAAARYYVDYSAVTKPQRQMGKVIILGCIAENTLVLTDKGAIPIQEITLQHKLWDGDTWVKHEGLLDKGQKECIQFNRTWMTPDHEVFISDTQKEEVWRHLDNTQSKSLVICLAIGKFLNTYQEQLLQNETLGISSGAPYVEQSISIFWRTLKKVIQQSAVNADEKQSSNLTWKHIVVLQAVTKKLSIDLSIDGTQLKPGALLKQLISTPTMAEEESECLMSGSRVLEHLFYMLWAYQDTTTQISNLTELIMKDTTSQVILSSAQEVKTCSTHDILNAGKNHRFTILTPNGPMIVSNCGYGMGKDTFVDTAKSQFGMIVSLEEADAAVKAYREKYYLVKKLWNELKLAATRTVITGQQQSYGHITFGLAKVNGILWLAMRLPSGKCIYYMEPRVSQEFIPDYEHMGRVPTITHMGTNPYSKQWCRMKLIPGRITENAVQGTAREVMAQGMLNVKTRMPHVRQIATVHDESIGLINNSHIGESTLAEFNHNLCDIEWAKGCPIKAEGWIGKRYRK